MEQEEMSINDAIVYKHKLIARFMELTSDFKNMDKKLLLLMPTPHLIEIGKALLPAYKLLEELKKKHPVIETSIEELKRKRNK